MKLEKAVFAGGCFWCTQSAFQKIPGVIEATSGYIGGQKANPTYEEVCSGTSGHYEAVEVTYDPAQISFEELLNVYWRDIDPTDPEGQFADRGSQYQTAIFCTNDEQRRIAEESKAKLDASGVFEGPIETQILRASTFYPAEKYHQNYAETNSQHYQMYRIGSGREGFTQEKWRGVTKVCPLPKGKVKIK